MFTRHYSTVVVPSILLLLVHKKSVVPSSHSKSECNHDLVWRGWLLACWPWMSAVVESSAVCNDADEFSVVDLCCRPA